MADTCKCGKGNDCCRVKKAAADKEQRGFTKFTAHNTKSAEKKCNCGCSSHK